MGKSKYEIATIDTETDPFKRGRMPKPFALGFYCGDHYEYFWGDDCCEQFANWLEEFCRSTGRLFVLFAHNGGKFDFHFVLPYIDNPVKIINGRIVKAAFIGGNIIQDSFAIIPAPLKSTGEKKEINYEIMERGNRNKPGNKRVILEYLESDCIVLYNWVARFEQEYGRRLTVGGTAMKQLQKFHDFARMPASMDPYFRDYYYGGRVECIRPGVHHGKFKVYDVNSMYPTVMRDRRHPINAQFYETDQLPKDPRKVYFAEIDATSNGALPLRLESGGIVFPRGRHIFKACSHEINIARSFGLLQIHKVISCHVARGTQTFGAFVEHFHGVRQHYRRIGDDFGEQFAKFMMNSSYGKFGQDPDNFRDWLISWEIGNDEPELQGYEHYSDCEYFSLWSRPSESATDAYYDVSVAASITSAARAVLLDGLQRARNPLYCDTDSIICEELPLAHDPTELGAWKDEGTFEKVVIAGKKLYALWSEKEIKHKRTGKLTHWHKERSKGGQLDGDTIEHIANGGFYDFESDKPVFSVGFDYKPVKRKFRKTA